MAAIEEAKAVAEEAKRKAEFEVALLEVDWKSLMLELGTVKDEVSSLQSQADKDKEAMEKEYWKALKVKFAYGYGCCVFKHNIYGDHPKVPNGMPKSADHCLLSSLLTPGPPLSRWLPRPLQSKFLLTRRPRSHRDHCC